MHGTFFIFALYADFCVRSLRLNGVTDIRGLGPVTLHIEGEMGRLSAFPQQANLGAPKGLRDLQVRMLPSVANSPFSCNAG